VEAENAPPDADRVAGPKGTDAAAVPASRNRAEAVAMTKRFM
jgi:hypothetical protein